jgi:hypothetical protein
MKYSNVLSTIFFIGILASLDGCASMSFTGKIQCTPNLGCTKEADMTIKSSGYNCNVPETCREEGGVFGEFLVYVHALAKNIFGIKTAFASGVDFDASQLRIDLSTINVAITNNSGNFVISVLNGQTLIVQQQFQYYRSGNSLYATDPAAINSWVSSINTPYDSVQIKNVDNDINYTPTTTADTSATIATSTVYQGTSLESDSTSFRINKGGCGIGVDCKRF